MPTLSLQIDACSILGVTNAASLQEIRDAYRLKAKRYHPDAGGEEWAFRLISQAYEALSTERVRLANARESESYAARGSPAPHRPSPPPPRPEPHSPGAGPGPSARPMYTPPPTGGTRPAGSRSSRETVRPGVQEDVTNPARVVDVEKLLMRYQPDHVWLISEHGRDERLLSCSLNLTWPAPGLPTPPDQIVGHVEIIEQLEAAFKAVSAPNGEDSARSTVIEGQFNGWLSYTHGEQADAAFDRLREELHKAGLTVKQWTRELVIPRGRG